MEEDPPEAQGQEHVGGHQPEGDGAGHGAAVQLQPAHDDEQRRDHQWDEGDVNRDEVLTHDSHGRESAQHQHGGGAHGPAGGGLVLVLNASDEPVRQQLGQTRVRHRHGEGPQQCVGQGDLGPGGQPVLEGDHGAADAQAGAQPARERPDEQGQDHMDAQHRQDEHDQDGEDDGVHRGPSDGGRLCWASRAGLGEPERIEADCARRA